MDKKAESGKERMPNYWEWIFTRWYSWVYFFIVMIILVTDVPYYYQDGGLNYALGVILGRIVSELAIAFFVIGSLSYSIVKNALKKYK